MAPHELAISCGELAAAPHELATSCGELVAITTSKCDLPNFAIFSGQISVIEIVCPGLPPFGFLSSDTVISDLPPRPSYGFLSESFDLLTIPLLIPVSRVSVAVDFQHLPSPPAVRLRWTYKASS